MTNRWTCICVVIDLMRLNLSKNIEPQNVIADRMRLHKKSLSKESDYQARTSQILVLLDYLYHSSGQ